MKAVFNLKSKQNDADGKKEYFVRLPGTAMPISITSSKSLTSSEILNVITRDYHLQNPTEYSLVLGPTTQTQGKVLTETINGSEDILEIWKLPKIATICLSSGTNLTSAANVLLDFRAPLAHLVPVLQRVLNLQQEELSFQICSDRASYSWETCRWLDSYKSLEKQGFPTDSFLVVFPLHILSKLPINGNSKEGWLFKRGIKSNFEPPTGTSVLKQQKPSRKMKRWVVLKDNFLLFYRNREGERTLRTMLKDDWTPSNVIPLEYTTVKLKPGTKTVDGQTPTEIRIKRVFNFGKKASKDYLITDDGSGNITEWFDLMKSRCLSLGDTQVFGVDIKEEMARGNNRSGIPLVVYNCVSNLDLNGLEVEGLFRMTGSSSLIEYFKEQFDQGVDVNLDNCPDIHAVAGLLKLYLRELPEPLLTNDLYDRFLALRDSPPQNKTEKVLELVKQLPHENQLVLQFLCSFLSRVQANSELNKMTLQNLGTCFGPALLRPKEEDMESLLRDTSTILEITKILIENHQAIHAILLSSGIFEKIQSTPPRKVSPSPSPLPPSSSVAAPHVPPSNPLPPQPLVKPPFRSASVGTSYPHRPFSMLHTPPAPPPKRMSTPPPGVPPRVGTPPIPPKTSTPINTSSSSSISPPVPKKPQVEDEKTNEVLLSRIKELETKLAAESESKKQLQNDMTDLQQRVRVLEDIIRAKLGRN